MAMASLESPLMEDTVDGAVDQQGNPSKRSSSGGWRSAIFIIGKRQKSTIYLFFFLFLPFRPVNNDNDNNNNVGCNFMEKWRICKGVEIAERFVYYGIGSNLINYLTGPLGMSTAVAAVNVNTWAGTATLLPLLGAFVADCYLGRYRTIVFASLLYILGLSLLTFSAILPSLITFQSQKMKFFSSYSPPQIQRVLFFFSLYLVAIGQGGHKPCTQAFGADQFDGQNPEQCKAKSSFFNWWVFGISAGSSLTYVVVSYVQDNLNWGLGFGIPCIVMVAALLVFLLGTRTYRFSIKRNDKSPFVRIGKVFLEAAKNWRTTPSLIDIQEEARGTSPRYGTHKFKFLNKALLAPDCSKGDGKGCSITDVEEAKAVLSLFPIWATSLLFAIVTAQSGTFFTKQAVTMDRSIGSAFQIPAASLQIFIPITMILFIPIYDRIFVPIARALTGKPSGITMLQRSGIGFFLCIVSMVFAATVEMKRLETAKEYGLVDMPNATVPMKVWWLIPQYILYGIADVFAMVGLQEFFYSQIPNELRSVGLSLYLSIYGVGSFLSGFLISVIEKATGGDGRSSWFNSNLNRAHIDYFYWLLAGLSAVELAAYLYFAKSFVYNRMTS